MTEPARHTRTLQQHRTDTVSEHIKQLPWVDIAFIVGGAALIVISFLSHVDVIHHIGTLSAQYIAHATAVGANLAAVVEMGRLFWAEIKDEETPIAHIRSESLRETHAGDSVKPQWIINAANADRALVGMIAEHTPPSEHDLKIGDQDAKLYGFFAKNADVVIKDLKKTGGDIGQIMFVLSEHKVHGAVTIGSLVIPAGEFCYVNTSGTKSGATLSTNSAFPITTQIEALVIAPHWLLKKISNEALRTLFDSNQNMTSYAQALSKSAIDNGAQEVPLIIINLGKKM